jgi:long-chain fatty acid transport protein
MKQSVIAIAVASALGLVVAEAGAAGFALHEQGVSGLGNAYAGAAAVAEDATTVWWNPAGMSRLPAGKHFSIGGAYIVPSTKFSDRGSTTPLLTAAPGSGGITRLGGTGGDAGDAALVPSAFFAMDINPKWNFGLSVSVPFGLATEYSPDWLGRFQRISAEVKTLNINPAVSYKISDTTSIGGGISYQRGEIDFLSAVNYSGLSLAATALVGAPSTALAGGLNVEGQNKTNVSGDAWGFNLGALFNAGPATRVGLHYRSSLKYDLEGTTSFTGVPAGFAASAALTARVANGNVKLSLKTPDSAAISAVHRLNDRWDLLGDLTWTHWNRIKALPLVRDNGTTMDTLTFNFRDTWRTSVGANYRLNSAWTLKMGAAYDQSPVPNAEDRTVQLPDNDRYWLSFGARWQVSRSGTLDLGYTYIKVKNADINHTETLKGTVVGGYKADVHILGVQYQHAF